MERRGLLSSRGLGRTRLYRLGADGCNTGWRLTKPYKRSIKRFLQRVREVIRRLARATAGDLIRTLSLMIGGWANYHRHGATGSGAYVATATPATTGSI